MEDIVRKAKVPVIVVKDEKIKFPFKNIVFVSNFEDDVSDAFEQALSIATKCEAKIHLLQINTKTDFNSIECSLKNIELLLKKFPDFENYSKAVYNEDSVETGINTFINEQPVDLIAMITHGKTGFLSLFSKSIAEGVTNHSKLPVMTIHISK
ncbi:universal stress protein [Flavobacterium gelidilacus]|uniref:universal stress protein n=1 Tax=Flavobacterium gelidilacus TaxID=206041 RepID=UPI00041DC7B4|nr:universal stress protein [Flavobacterium gelidilacus]